MIQENVQILWNTIECSGYYRLGISCNKAYSEAQPGQFVMTGFPGYTDPLLRRPFSIHRLIESEGKVQGLEILYKVVGKGTEKLSMLRKGDGLSLIGPLGNSFFIPENARRIFIAAGGVGVAPMYFLTSALQKKGTDLSKCMVFIGGRSKEDILCMNDFFIIGMNTVHVTTDDGSAGEKNLVTGPMERAINEGKPDIIYACGPMPMLKAAGTIAEKYQIPCQISIETMMACGMGACLGCAVRSKKNTDEYLHACKDGPVFDSDVLEL